MKLYKTWKSNRPPINRWHFTKVHVSVEWYERVFSLLRHSNHVCAPNRSRTFFDLLWIYIFEHPFNLTVQEREEKGLTIVIRDMICDKTLIIHTFLKVQAFFELKTFYCFYSLHKTVLYVCILFLSSCFAAPLHTVTVLPRVAVAGLCWSDPLLCRKRHSGGFGWHSVFG